MRADSETYQSKRSIKGLLVETARFFKVAPYAISLIWESQPRLIVILAVSAVLDGIAPAITVLIMRYLLDAIVNAYQNHGQLQYVETATYMIVLQFAVTGAIACISRCMAYFKGVLSTRLMLSMQTNLINSLSRLEMKDYDNPGIYDMITRARGEAQSNKPFSLVSGICDMASSLITWISFSVFLLRFSPIVVVAMFAICIPYFALNIYFAKANYNLQFGRTHEQRAAGYLLSCFTDRRSLPEIIVRNLWCFLHTKWVTLVSKFMRQDFVMMKRKTVAEIIIIGFTNLGRGGVSLYIIVKCLSHFADYSVGQMMMYIQSFSGGVNALAQVMQQLSGVYEGSCYLQNYKTFLEVKQTSTPRQKEYRKVPDAIESIEFRNVGFKYEGSAAYTLQGLNLVFRKGQSTLLVGNNGAGKTTVARLLIGLYSPSDGQILINGHDMKDYNLVLLQKTMSIIFQDFVRYALTVEENIGLGSVEHMTDAKRVMNAAKAARLERIIARLPKGYATMLGKEFPNGHDLSLGEWQRVCLARLFMRDAAVTVYDEPSASLDVETESELLREISLSGKDKVCVLISHRMLRTDIADRIVVIENGKVVELGGHNELLLLRGRYSNMWEAYHSLNVNDRVSSNGESNGHSLRQ